GRTVEVFALTNSTAERIFRLTNPPNHDLAYTGVVMALEKRYSSGWYARGSYTLSKTTGLQVSSNVAVSGAQVSTVGPPGNSTFGRDPNDFTNAYGRLPNDRPH